MLFPSSLVPSLHVLVFGKKTFLYLYIMQHAVIPSKYSESNSVMRSKYAME